MALAERFDGALNHCRKIATETVGHGGCAEIAAVIESSACSCEGREHLGFDVGLASTLLTASLRSRERWHTVTFPPVKRLHGCENGRQRVNVADALLALYLM